MTSVQIDLSIIIPSYNTASLVDDCIESIRANPPTASVEIIVADNASTDGTADRVARCFKDVTLVGLPVNRGYGAACNAGAARARGWILLFLNSDTQMLKGSLDVVVNGFREYADLGAAACHELSAQGETVMGCRSHHTLRSGISFLTGFRLFRKEGDRYKVAGWDRKSERWVDNVSGFAWAIRRDIFARIGGFDENLFLYFEEQDMARRLEQAGLRIRYFSEAKIIHLNARSTASLGPFRRRRRWVESFVGLRRKHGLSASAWLDRLVLYPFLVVWWLGRRLNRSSTGGAP